MNYEIPLWQEAKVGLGRDPAFAIESFRADAASCLLVVSRTDQQGRRPSGLSDLCLENGDLTSSPERSLRGRGENASLWDLGADHKSLHLPLLSSWCLNHLKTAAMAVVDYENL